MKLKSKLFFAALVAGAFVFQAAAGSKPSPKWFKGDCEVAWSQPVQPQ